MFRRAQLGPAKPTPAEERCPMAWWNSRPAARGPAAQNHAVRRRAVLTLDRLEDRHAPATIAFLGQAASDIIPIPQVDLNASAVGRFAVAAPLPDAAFLAGATGGDDVPFGFFHPFCQNGFGGSDVMMQEPPVPMPRPVTPPPMTPLDAALSLPMPELPDLPMLAAPLADGQAPAPMLETPPAVPRIPEPDVIVPTREQPPPPLAEEPAPAVAELSVLASAGNSGPRHGFAALGGLMAASSLLYSRNVRERRYGDAIPFSR
jgi:hypothetical protein